MWAHSVTSRKKVPTNAGAGKKELLMLVHEIFLLNVHLSLGKDPILNGTLWHISLAGKVIVIYTR